LERFHLQKYGFDNAMVGRVIVGSSVGTVISFFQFSSNLHKYLQKIAAKCQLKVQGPGAGQ